MNVQYAGNQFMSRRLIEVIQELRDYLEPEAGGLSDEDVVHKVMCKAIDYYRQLSELKPKEPPFPEPPHRYGKLRRRDARLITGRSTLAHGAQARWEPFAC